MSDRQSGLPVPEGAVPAEVPSLEAELSQLETVIAIDLMDHGCTTWFNMAVRARLRASIEAKRSREGTGGKEALTGEGEAQ